MQTRTKKANSSLHTVVDTNTLRQQRKKGQQTQQRAYVACPQNETYPLILDAAIDKVIFGPPVVTTIIGKFIQGDMTVMAWFSSSSTSFVVIITSSIEHGLLLYISDCLCKLVQQVTS